MTETADPIDPAADVAAADDETPTRRCGRCRLQFAIPADTHPMELHDWWACPTCVDSLLPGQRRGSR